MAEFDLIEQYFKFSTETAETGGLIKGIGDDCAILDVPVGKQLVTSVDTLVSGVHFFNDAKPEDIAYKALAVNVSDIAAMGATAKWFTLAISLPEIDHPWLEQFSLSLQQTCEKFKVKLIGGDTTQGPLNISITIFGLLDKGCALQRSGAKVDDDIWVTGSLGNAAFALQLHSKLSNKITLTDDEKRLWQSLIKPEPPVVFAQELPPLVNAAIDLSDGLQADLGHILKQSNCGAELQIMSLPLSEALIDTVGLEAARNYALSGGDDYELCFTANKNNRATLELLAAKHQVSISRIGRITAKGFVTLLAEQEYQSSAVSWQHFSNDE